MAHCLRYIPTKGVSLQMKVSNFLTVLILTIMIVLNCPSGTQAQSLFVDYEALCTYCTVFSEQEISQQQILTSTDNGILIMPLSDRYNSYETFVLTRILNATKLSPFANYIQSKTIDESDPDTAIARVRFKLINDYLIENGVPNNKRPLWVNARSIPH